MKIVINAGTGFFHLSDRASAMLELDESSVSYEHDHHLRGDPRLVRVVEQLGAKASGVAGTLVVLEIPDGIDWVLVVQDDGREFVVERGHVWGLRLPPRCVDKE